MRRIPRLPSTKNPDLGTTQLRALLRQSKPGRVFRHVDFRYYWIGAFVSFSGSWIQSIAEGYFVFQLTRDESKLALVGFCASLPVFLFGFIAGSMSDVYDKRKSLILAQFLYFLGATYLAIATWSHFVTFGQILLVASLLGIVATYEMPIRQSVVSRVVPAEDLPAAIPITAMTFNSARILGPAIGTAILSALGVAWCYFLNGLSFLALIWTAISIKSDLTASLKERQPIKDLIVEGYNAVMRDSRLKGLFILEVITGLCGLFYLRLLPAITGDMLGLDRVSDHASKAGLGFATMSVGIGAFIGLIIVTTLSDSPNRAKIVRYSMSLMAVGLIVLSFTRVPMIAYFCMILTGMASIMQLNTTNALFQIYSDERVRGRVLSMHIWALNGLSPFGMLFFGWFAKISHEWSRTTYPNWMTFEAPTNQNGVALALFIGGCGMAIGAFLAWLYRGKIERDTFLVGSLA